MRLFRLEFFQPDGRWTGPYCAEYMTEGAFAVRDRMVPHHRTSSYHQFPDAHIFSMNPGVNRYVCATDSLQLLAVWFGEYFQPLLDNGGHIGVYEVPLGAIAENDGKQVVYQQRQGTLLSRQGKTYPSMHRLRARTHPDKYIETAVVKDI